jgi:serine/threonine protein kinase
MTRGTKHHFLSQWADGGNLQDFWTSIPRPSLDAEFVKEMVQQLRGLADAVNALHQCMGFYHYADLQPDKILRFQDHTRVGIFKIDGMRMGLAKHHAIATYPGPPTQRPTSAQYKTITYHPPEAFIFKLGEEGMSDFCDMWSMGCILLELMVWLLYGYDELKTFNERIRGPMGESRPYFLLEKVDGNQVAKMHSTVQAYMNHVSNDPEYARSTALSDLLEIVKTRLLVVSPPTSRPSTVDPDQGDGNLTVTNIDAIDQLPRGPSRITAQILSKLLDDMMSKGEKNEHYWFSGTARDGLRGPEFTSIPTANFLSPDVAQQQRPKGESSDNSDPPSYTVFRLKRNICFD